MDAVFYFVIIGIIVIPIIVTLSLAKKSKENKFLKYIPSIISFLIGILLYSIGEAQTGLFAGLYELFFAFGFFAFFIISIVTALIYEIYMYCAKSKNNN